MDRYGDQGFGCENNNDDDDMLAKPSSLGRDDGEDCIKVSRRSIVVIIECTRGGGGGIDVDIFLIRHHAGRFRSQWQPYRPVRSKDPVGLDEARSKCTRKRLFFLRLFQNLNVLNLRVSLMVFEP